MTAAAILLTELNQIVDRAEEEKNKVLKPLNAARAAELKRWKPLLQPLEAAIDVVRAKMSTYQTQFKKDADGAAQRIAERVAPGRGNLTAETAVSKIDALAKPQKEITTGADSSVHFRTVKKLFIDDRDALYAYIFKNNLTALVDIDETALKNHLIQMGVVQIAITGAHVEEVQEAANYR